MSAFGFKIHQQVGQIGVNILAHPDPVEHNHRQRQVLEIVVPGQPRRAGDLARLSGDEKYPILLLTRDISYRRAGVSKLFPGSQN